MIHRVLVTVNGTMGAVLAVSGAITAYADTLGGAGRYVSLTLGGIGVAQLVLASALHTLWVSKAAVTDAYLATSTPQSIVPAPAPVPTTAA